MEAVLTESIKMTEGIKINKKETKILVYKERENRTKTKM